MRPEYLGADMVFLFAWLKGTAGKTLVSDTGSSSLNSVTAILHLSVAMMIPHKKSQKIANPLLKG